MDASGDLLAIKVARLEAEVQALRLLDLERSLSGGAGREPAPAAPPPLPPAAAGSEADAGRRLVELSGADRLIELEYAYHPKPRDWSALPGRANYLATIAASRERYADLLRAFVPLREALARIPRDTPADETEPNWANDWMPPLDAISIYGLLAVKKPRLYMEVGSGFSTKFARRAIRDLGLDTRIVSIDPFPRAAIDGICDEVVRERLEDCPPSVFERLGPDDLLLVDNSHRSFQNSDVTVFFTEILPCLPSGCIYGIHDIFLPLDYPAAWKARFYNEQYLLMAYLAGGAGGDAIVLPTGFVPFDAELSALRDEIFEAEPLRDLQATGGLFWMRKA